MQPNSLQDDETKRVCKDGWVTLMDLMLFGLVIRAVALLVFARELEADPDDYRLLAETFRETGVYGWYDASTGVASVRPTAFRPPLYPVVLAALATGGQVTSTVVAGLHWILGTMTILLTYLFARRCQLGRWSFLAAVVVACDPILLNQSCLVMTETVATCLAILALYSLARLADSPNLVSFLLAGGTLALTALCRPSFLPWVGLVSLVLLGPRTKTTTAAIGWMLGIGIVLSPWIVRNYGTFGRVSATTTHGGYTLLLGNNPLFYEHLRAGGGATWDAAPFSEAWELRRYSDDSGDQLWQHLDENPERYAGGGAPIGRDEFEDDRFAYRLAQHYIGQQPEMFVYSCGIRIARLWQLMPQRRNERESQQMLGMRIAVGVWYAVLALLAVCGIAGLRIKLLRAPWLWGLFLLVSFTAVHTFYWSNMRMRAPLMPFVCVLAAAGVRELVGWVSQGKRRHALP